MRSDEVWSSKTITSTSCGFSLEEAVDLVGDGAERDGTELAEAVAHEHLGRRAGRRSTEALVQRLPGGGERRGEIGRDVAVLRARSR